MFGWTATLLRQAFRADARRMESHLARGLVAATVLMLLAVIQWNAAGGSAPGLRYLESLVWLTFFAITAAGYFWFPLILAEERSQGTLGLLLLAGVGPGVLLVSKSLARLGLLLLVIGITLPFWWLAVALGGVTFPQVAGCFLLLAVHLAIVSQAATLCSVLFRSPIIACAVSVFLVMSLTAGPQALTDILKAIGPPAWPYVLKAVQLQGLTTIEGIRAVLLLASTGSWLKIWPIVEVNVGLASALFVLSWVLFRWFHRYEDGRRTEGWQDFLSLRWNRLIGSFRRGRCWRHALAWKEFHESTNGVFGLTVLSAILGLGTLFWSATQGNSLGTAATVIGLISVASNGLVCASLIFYLEIHRGTWDSLRMTPYSLRTMTLEKFMGWCPLLIPPVVFLGAGLWLEPDQTEWLRREITRQPWFYGATAVLVITAAVFSLHTICYASLKMAVWLSGPVAAATIGLPTLVWYLVPGRSAGQAHLGTAISLLGLCSIGMCVATVFLQQAIVRTLEEPSTKRR